MNTGTTTHSIDHSSRLRRTLKVGLATTLLAGTCVVGGRGGDVAHAGTTPTISVTDFSETEFILGNTFSFGVLLSAPAAAPVTFNIATADSTATAGSGDYDASALLAQTIPIGGDGYVFNVTVNDDSIAEFDETFFVNLTGVTGATVVDGQGVGTIENDDPLVETTTVVTSSPNPSTFGQPVTFTATVTPSRGSAPTGTVTFTDITTATTLGLVSLDGGGQAALTTALLSPGSHSVQATYNPDRAWGGSSDSTTQQVNQLATSTVLSSSPNPSSVGEAVTFTATVTNPGGSQVPTGAVTFVDETAATTLGTITIGSGGQAQLVTSVLPAGLRTISATYIPDSPLFVGSSDELDHQVNESAVTTTTSSTTTTTEPATTTTTAAATTTTTTTTTTSSTTPGTTTTSTTDPVETTEPPPTSEPPTTTGTAPTTQPPAAPTASVALSQIAQGQQQTGFGTGFVPGETVTGEQHSTPFDLGAQTVGADGTVTFTWTIRANESPGEHTFVMTGSASGAASATFTVVPSGALPATGSDDMGIVAAAAAIVALGSLIVVQSRRRATPG